MRVVYQCRSPVGSIVRAARCYVDVDVPQLKRKVMVGKTSVVREPEWQKPAKAVEKL
jgi:hypothetical protein